MFSRNHVRADRRSKVDFVKSWPGRALGGKIVVGLMEEMKKIAVDVI